MSQDRRAALPATLPPPVTGEAREVRAPGRHRERWQGWRPAVSRVTTLAGVVVLVGCLPWLTGHDPALALLRARSAEQEATPEALEAIRRDLGLDDGPLTILGQWLLGLTRGDAGTSWLSGRPVLPGTLDALGVSVTLVAFAVVVATVLAAGLCVPTLLRGLRGEDARTAGVFAVLFTALPEFLIAATLLVVGAVWLGWFPPYGWQGVSYAVLPALALGLPAGGLLGRLFADGLATAFTEPWVLTWQVAGVRRSRLVVAVLHRTVPGLITQVTLTLMGMLGGAIAVERVFAIPGLGRATLGAAAAQDVPALQVGILLLLVIAAALGVVGAGVSRLLLGPVVSAGRLPPSPPRPRSPRGAWVVPISAATLLAGLVLAGLGRDPYASVLPRLAPPSLAAPLGADASGRDLLARVSAGALTTISVALVVVLVCLVVGLVVGLAPRLAAGPIDVTNAMPPVVAGLLVAAVAGTSVTGAAVAVALTCWAPLAAHTAALVEETRAQPHVAIAPVLGVGPARLVLQHVLPSVVGPVLRHAMLRLPGIALALASLGFLGLGPQPPRPEWGLVLAEGMPYVERAPWAVLVPAAALAALSVLAVSCANLSLGRISAPAAGMIAAVPTSAAR